MALLAETRGSVGAVEEAMQAAAKHDGRSETLAALVAEAKGMVEHARAAEAERARVAAEKAAVAAEAAAAAAALKAVKRQQLEEELASLALTVQSDTLRMQQVQAELGSGSGTSKPDEESQCVLCLDAPKDHIITPCGHQCVCGACAEKLKGVKRPACPICREPINATFKVFVA
jgi:hypothetical protein